MGKRLKKQVTKQTDKDEKSPFILLIILILVTGYGVEKQ